MTKKFTEAQLAMFETFIRDSVCYTTTWTKGDIHPNTGYSLERRGYAEHWSNEYAGGDCHYIIFKLTAHGRKAYIKYLEEAGR